MDRRPDWKETSTYNTYFQFKWQPFSRGIRYELFSPQIKQIVNHVECHEEITTKDGLFRNLSSYCELNKLNVFRYVPLTFVVNVDSASYNYDIEMISKAFGLIQDACNSKSLDQNSISSINSGLSQFVCYKERRMIRSCIPNLFPTHINGKNLWIIKPTGFNRGRGVQVFSSIEEMKNIIHNYTEGVIDEEMPAKQDTELKENCSSEQFIHLPESTAWEHSHPPISNLNNLPHIIKTKNFVIQKYIERPLLISKRKFDIRVWVLLSQENKCYFFKEGYLRMSSREYKLDTNNKEIHLTNNAIQKFTANYGMQEDGNQISFEGFQKHLNEFHSEKKCNFRDTIYAQMKEIASLSLQSVRKKLNPSDIKHCFEIFGYDFMIDEELNVWLIEVNTNPCLEESSAILKELIPRMLGIVLIR